MGNTTRRPSLLVRLRTFAHATYRQTSISHTISARMLSKQYLLDRSISRDPCYVIRAQSLAVLLINYYELHALAPVYRCVQSQTELRKPSTNMHGPAALRL